MVRSGEPSCACASAHPPHDEVRIVVVRDDARAVAAEFRDCVRLHSLTALSQVTREEVTSMRRYIKLYVKWLDRLNWGCPAGDVTLRMPRSEAVGLTVRMLELGGSATVEDPASRRNALAALQAGVRLSEQLS